MSTYQVIWDDDVYSEVASTWLDAKDRLGVMDAIREIDQTLMRDPRSAGRELSEGLLWIDCTQVRAIESIDELARRVTVHRIVRQSSVRLSTLLDRFCLRPCPPDPISYFNAFRHIFTMGKRLL